MHWQKNKRDCAQTTRYRDAIRFLRFGAASVSDGFRQTLRDKSWIANFPRDYKTAALPLS
jgi:hypothetical protein